MRRRFRWFAAVSAGVTAADLLILLLVESSGQAVVVADVVAVAVASLLSFVLHRNVTFAEDPYVRWVRQPRSFLLAAALAGAVDVAVTSALATTLPVLLAKVIALVLAGAVRVTAYRAVLLTDTRRDLRTLHDRQPATGERRLTVVLPAFAEADRITDAVTRVRAALAAVDAEILVVDDGSPDDTAARAEAAGAKVLVLPENRGKGAAVRAGMLAATGRTVAFTDADLAYDPEQLLVLLDAVESGWDVAVGNRYHPDSEAVGRPSLLRQASSRLFNLLTATVLLGQYRDTQCGCKAFRSDVARQLFRRTRLDGFAFDVEVLHLVERDRLSLKEVPVRVADGGSSTVRVGASAGRMVRDLFRVRRWGGEGWYDLDPGSEEATPAG